jgi:hypothetical protein
MRRPVAAPPEACGHSRFYLDAHRREVRCELCRQTLDTFELLREASDAFAKLEEELREARDALRVADAAALGHRSAFPRSPPRGDSYPDDPPF